MNPILVQLIGFAGLFCYLLSYQLKSNLKLYIAQTVGNVFFMIQFLLLGGYTGCINLALGIIRNLIVMQFGKHAWARSKIWVPIFIAIFVGAMLFTWDGWTSILPFLALATCTVAFWTDNALNIRKANLFVACPAWLIYDIIFHSYAGILNEVITITSILISIWRFGWKNLGDPNSGFSQKQIDSDSEQRDGANKG